MIFDGQNGRFFSACRLQIVGTCEIITKGGFMEDMNQILLFDWEKDIMSNLPDCRIGNGEDNESLFCSP